MLYIVYSNIVLHIVQQNINYCTSFKDHWTICTILYKTLYNFLFKPIFRLYNFSSCLCSTTFCTILYNLCTMLYKIVQVVQVVQDCVQYCNGLVCRWIMDMTQAAEEFPYKLESPHYWKSGTPPIETGT